MQSVKHLSGNTSPPYEYDSFARTEHQETRHTLPIGVPQERVDPHTLELLERLFGTKGLQFLAAFLRLAEAKQHALADLGVADCAVITTKTIRELAKRIGWGYDTTEKYLVVLCALQFLSKEKSAQGITYSFPLHRYTPQQTSLDALETVIKRYRPKVQSFARKAKKRLLVSLHGQKSPILPVVARESLPPAFDLPAVEEDIARIMGEELGNGLLPQRLLLRITGALRYRCHLDTPQIPAQYGDQVASVLPDASPFSEPKGDSASGSLPLESSASKNGDSVAFSLPQQSPVSEHTGDFPSLNESPISTKGNSFVALVSRNGRLDPEKGRLSPQKGDSPLMASEPASPEKSPFSEQNGDSEQVISSENGRFSAETGDFPSESPEVCVSAPYTYNVSYLITTITKGDNVIRKRIAQFLAKTLEKSDYENGYPTFSKYLKAFKQYTPEVIGRAFLVTMVLVHGRGWQVDSLGATFTTQCKILSGQKPLATYTLDEVEEWMRSWEHLAYPDLLAAVAAPAIAQPDPEPASLIPGSQKGAPKTSGYLGRQTYKKGNRTYGMHYTGEATILNKGTNNWGSPGPPSGKN